MKVRLTERPEIGGWASRFNLSSLSEVILQLEDDCDSVYIKDLDVYLEKTMQWKSLSQAMKDKDIIHDNFNTIFFEPDNEADRERGYTE